MESHGLWTSKRFPELTWKVLFVGEALVGNDAIDQAEQSRERSLLWLVCFHELYIFHFSIIFFCKNQSRHHPFQLLYLPEFSRWCYNKQRRSRPALRQLSLWQVTKFNRSLVDLSADPRCGPPWYRCSTQQWCNNISIILGVPSFSPNCVWAPQDKNNNLFCGGIVTPFISWTHWVPCRLPYLLRAHYHLTGTLAELTGCC